MDLETAGDGQVIRQVTLVAWKSPSFRTCDVRRALREVGIRPPGVRGCVIKALRYRWIVEGPWTPREDVELNLFRSFPDMETAELVVLNLDSRRVMGHKYRLHFMDLRARVTDLVSA